MDKLKIGIIGIGNMGSTHARNIVEGKCPELELVAVADIDDERLKWAKSELPDTVVLYDDAEDMLQSKTLDACIVAVPHYDHCRYASRCLNLGIHVMVEKPAGVYTRQVRFLNDTAAHSDAVFAMMFNQRTNKLYIKMKELVQSGELGEIKRVSWIITDWYRTQAYYDSGAWRATWSGEGGGVLLNQCPHQLDLFQWICGLPVKVDAKMHFGKWHDIEVEDDVTAYMEFENGATGTFITTTGDAPGTNRFEIDLEKGKLVCEDGVLKIWKSDVNEREWIKECKSNYEKPKYEYTEFKPDEESTQHVGVLNAFASRVLHGSPLIANGEEGIRGLTLSNAMHLSAFLGESVTIPFDEDVYYKELMKRVQTSRRKPNVRSKVSSLDGSF